MKNNYEQKILSDANSIFIKHVLNVSMIKFNIVLFLINFKGKKKRTSLF